MPYRTALRGLIIFFVLSGYCGLSLASTKNTTRFVLTVSQEDFLRKLARQNNQQFNQVLQNTVKAQADNKSDFFTEFKLQWENIDPKTSMADVFDEEGYLKRLTSPEPNSKVIKKLRSDFDQLVKSTAQVLKSRVTKSGLTNKHITVKTKTATIIFDLPEVKDPIRLKKILLNNGRLELWGTFEVSEALTYLVNANAMLDSILPQVKSTDTINAEKKNPLWQIFYPNIKPDGHFGEGPLLGFCRGQDTSAVNRLLSHPVIAHLFPPNLKLLWGVFSIKKGSDVFGLYAIKQNKFAQLPPATPPGNVNQTFYSLGHNLSAMVAPIANEDITDAVQSFDRQGNPEIQITTNAAGAKKWENLTDMAANASVDGKHVNKCIAVVIDNRVFCAPKVMDKIAGGRLLITGLTTLEEAQDLAVILKSGKLEVRVTLIE
ncbi:MAG: secDF [Bacteroidota bacterium]|nr:secDF [Bacteroidota bacterium]